MVFVGDCATTEFSIVGKSRNESLLKKVAVRLKELRQKRDVTQEVFYNETGINISRIERAKRDISLTTLSSICIYFEITLEDFFKNIE